LRFGHCAADECLEHFKLKNGNIMLLKPFDEKRNDYKEKVSEFSLKRFVQKFSLKKVISWEEKWTKHIFTNKNPGLFLMRSSTDDGKYNEILEKVAQEYRGEIQVIDADINSLGTLKDYLGIKEEDLPFVIIVDNAGDLKKFKLEGEITQESLVEFCLNFRNKNKLKLHLKSEDVPDNQYGLVYEVVGTSFPEVVFDQTKDVLVYFEAQENYCKTCKDVEPVIEELAKKLKLSPNLLIARMDGTKNEVENIRMKEFPQVKFWKATDKKRIVDFTGDKTKVEDYIKFLKKNSRHKIIEENKEEL